MQSFEVLNFLGLKTSLAQPPGNSAKAMSNLVRFRHKGEDRGTPYAWLEQADGYAKKFDLPAATQAGNKITLCTITDIKNFYVKEHSGKNITVAVGTYRKTSRYDAGVYLDRSGIWMRPYWSGAAWIDAWFELTEIEILKGGSTGTADILFTTADAFANDYFKNWTIVFNDYTQAGDADNYFLITASISTPEDQITYFGANASLTRVVTNTKCILVRNFIGQEMPASLTGMLIGLYNEIRLTTGNTAADTLVMAGFRSKSFGWATTDKVCDRLIADRGFLDFWRYTFFHDQPTQVASVLPMPKGRYYLKDSLLLDDNNESALRDLSSALPVDTISQSGSLTVPGAGTAMVSDGTYMYVIYGPVGSSYLVKYRLDTFELVTSMPIGTISAGAFNGMILINGFIYIAESGSIEKIDAALMTSVAVLPVYLTGEIFYSFATDGTTLYGGVSKAAGAKSAVKKIVLATFVPTTELDTTAVGDNVYSLFYNTPTNELYAGIDSTIAWIALGPFTLTGNDATSALVAQFSASSDATKILAALNTSPGEIETFSTTSHTATHITYFAENNANAILYNGTNVWVGLGVNPIIIKKLTGDGITELSSYTGVTGQAFCANVLMVNAILFALTVTTPASVIQFNTNPATAFQIMDGTTELQFYDYISAGAAPKRGKAIRHYISKDDVDFYLVKEISLLDGGTTWDATASYNSFTKHFYHKSALVTINGEDYAAIGALAQVQIGRTISDAGAYPFLVGAVAGLKTFIGNVLINGVKILNQVIASTKGVDGEMNDVFPNDAANVIDVEYSDGDQITCLLALGERVLCLKGRNTVLITPNPQTGGYMRDLVDRGVGCCSARAANVFEETAYYLDYNGARAFNTNGGMYINDDWILDWKALTKAQKEAACSIIDILNRQWIVSAGGKQWIMDLDTRDWVGGLLTDVPTQFADNIPDTGTPPVNPGFIDFLSGMKIQNMNKGTRHDGANFEMNWWSNRIEPLLGKEGYVSDLLPEYLIVKYASSVNINVYVYLNDSSSALNATPYVLSASNIEAIIGLPISARCKGFCLKFVATTTAASQTVQIKYLQFLFDKIEQGGDVLALSA